MISPLLLVSPGLYFSHVKKKHLLRLSPENKIKIDPNNNSSVYYSEMREKA